MFKLLCFTACLFLVSCAKIDDLSEQSTGAQKFEKIPKNEAEHIREIVQLTPELQDMRKKLTEQNNRVLRGVHAKSHGCVDARFIVNEGINKQYQVGLFAEPGKQYQAQIRFSNASVKIAPDLEGGNGSRGMALKIFDVEGDFITKDNGQKNQDFLMINTPEFAFSSVRGYRYLTKALHASELGDNPASLLLIGKKLIGIRKGNQQELFKEPDQNELEQLRKDSDIKLPDGFNLSDLKELIATLKTIGTKINTKFVRNPLQIQYFGAASFLFGTEQVMKFTVVPTKIIEQTPFEETENPDKDYLRKALTSSMQHGADEIIYNFNIQLRNKDFGEANQLIEDPNSTWEDEINNYTINVAKIIIPTPQDPNTVESINACEVLAFNPWHTLKAHQPIGGINRLRKDVYFASEEHRKSQ